MRPMAVDSLPHTTWIEALALLYVALPTVLFVAGWIVAPFGSAVACATALAILMLLRRHFSDGSPTIGPLLLPIVAIAGLWCLMAGLGHYVFANSDWVVRDAVLVDLIREPWPVRYTIDGTAMLLRAPIGYFLPAAVIGKLWGVFAAETALFVWTIVGVSLVFAMMLRDRPSLKPALVRIGIFIVFSGMDIAGTIAHYNPHAIGDHLEWWAYLFQYSSQTTQLFWVPNHALPGWIAIAWLLGQPPRRLPIAPAVLFVVFAPLWSPLTAIGIAPIAAVAILRQAVFDGARIVMVKLLDWRILVPAVASLVLVYPYLIAGSDKVASGSNADMRWVGEDFVPRYIEFVLFEFVGFALLLLKRDRGNPVLWAAIVVLLVLPFYRFGPYNDLAMRASIPALTLLAIRLGSWLSMPLSATRDRCARVIAVILLAIGAVTPFMEFARALIEPRWPMNEAASVIDVTRGTHYLTPSEQPWLRQFLRQPDAR